MLNLARPAQRYELESLCEVRPRDLVIRAVEPHVAARNVIGEASTSHLGEGLTRILLGPSPDRLDVGHGLKP